MPAMRAILLSCTVLALPACTFVKLAPGAQQVKVLSAAPAGCERRGDGAVSITHRVGFYERDDTRVRDELELLARNEHYRYVISSLDEDRDVEHEEQEVIA